MLGVCAHSICICRYYMYTYIYDAISICMFYTYKLSTKGNGN